MIKRPTWILLAVFAVSVAGLLLWNRFKPEGQASSEPVPTQQPKLYSFDAGVVTRLELSDATHTVHYIKQPDANWYLSTETMAAADTGAILSKLASLLSVRTLAVLDTPPADELTGLAQPALTMIMTLDDGKTYQLVVGAPTATGSGYYVRAGGARVVVVNKTTIDQIMGLLTSPPLATPAAPAGIDSPTPAP